MRYMRAWQRRSARSSSSVAIYSACIVTTQTRSHAMSISSTFFGESVARDGKSSETSFENVAHTVCRSGSRSILHGLCSGGRSTWKSTELRQSKWTKFAPLFRYSRAATGKTVCVASTSRRTNHRYAEAAPTSRIAGPSVKKCEPRCLVLLRTGYLLTCFDRDWSQGGHDQYCARKPSEKSRRIASSVSAAYTPLVIGPT